MTFPMSRNVADLIIIFAIFAILLEWKSISINKHGIYWILASSIVLLYNAANGYQNVTSAINNELFFRLQWLIEDREIGSFVTLGDFYRNTIIYLRYILVPMYFSLGIYFVRCIKAGKSYKLISYTLLALLIINVVVGLLNNDDRLKGLFDNTATLSSLGLITIYFALLSDGKKYYVTFAILMSLLAIFLSKTLSAYVALLIFTIFYCLRINRPHIYSLVITFVLSAIITISGMSEDILSLLSQHVYIGSLLNRIATWSGLVGFLGSLDSILFGLGAFPVFTDNIFVWLICGFGVFGMIFLSYVNAIASKSRECSLFITIILWQGILFPGYIMPYAIFSTFFILGVLFSSDRAK